ncbi:MAG: GNAT family N-acetyltransferase [Hyphomicrobium sp.]
MLPIASTRNARPEDLPAISALHALVFGPGRYARSAYRVREGKGMWSPFCRLAEIGTRVIAALRLTPVVIGETDGAVLLGPVAVDPEFAGQGYGRRLISEALDDMKAHGVRLVILVGDELYYGRFGFRTVPYEQITLPGPVNPTRVLALELQDGALPTYRGVISARPSAEAGKG